MQTFLPYPDLLASVKALDSRRLGKQRVEAYQILRILLGVTNGKGWRNHPAVLMWTGYTEALMRYHNLCIQEWVTRGFRNQMQQYECSDNPPLPPWMGCEKLHESHRSNLIRKDPEFYAPLFPGISGETPYWWPSYNGGQGGYPELPPPKKISPRKKKKKTAPKKLPRVAKSKVRKPA